DNVFNVESSTNKPNKDISKTLRPDTPIVEDWISNSEDETEIESVPKQREPSFVKSSEHVKTSRESVKKIEHNKQAENFSTTIKSLEGNPQQTLKDKGVIDSGWSRHMIGNKSFLSDFEEIDGGYVAFGGNPKGGKISGEGKNKTGKLDFDNVYFVKELKFNLFSVSQMCEKKNNVLFIDIECVVLSSDYKLPDENYVLLRVPRENNMYNVDIKNVVPLGGLTCLFAKVALEESNLWHRRLGHINFKTINKLVKVSPLLDEQHRKTSSTDEGTSSKPGVPDVPKYDFKNDDMYKDDEETSSNRTESDIIKIPVLNQSSTEYNEEEEENIDDEEKIDEEEDDEVTKELYNDVNVNLGNRDADMTDKPNEPVQSSSVSSDFTSKLQNLKNPSLADNEIASLMDTTTHHEEPKSQTPSLYTVPVTTTPEVTSVFTTTIPPTPLFFNPLPQQATPTVTSITSKVITLFPSLLDFLFIFKFNDIVTNLEKDLLEIKQVDQLDKGYHAILLPFTGNYMLLKCDLRLVDEHFKSVSVDVISNITPSDVKIVESKHKTVDVNHKGMFSTEEPKHVMKNNYSPTIIEDWHSNDESEEEISPTVEVKTVKPSIEKIKYVKPTREIVKTKESLKQHKHHPRGNL
nr:ribonuclease H-like domain-containing protein [Tanacetum cinerariifolium]